MSTGFSSFDDDFGNAPIKPKYASEATTKLPDGDYECEVTAGIMKDDEHGPRFTLLMVVLTAGAYAGWKVEKTTFLTKKQEGGGRVKDDKRMGELKNDLATMGFDVANWTPANKRPFGAQLAVACAVMKGVKLKVRKKQNDEYANLYLNKRLEDGKPAAFGPAEMVAPPPADQGAGQFGQSPLDAVPTGTVTAPPTTDPLPF